MRAVTRFRNKIKRLPVWRRRLGTAQALQWGLLRLAVILGLPEPAAWRLRPRLASYPLFARLRESSDMHVFDQIFLFEEYSCLKELKEPLLVVDLGANVGFSAAYFLIAFPKARIVAVEPDKANVALCRANLARYGDRALVVHGAAWSRCTKLKLIKGELGDDREWSFQVEEVIEGSAAEAEVEAWDVASLIGMTEIDRVDILKSTSNVGSRQLLGNRRRLGFREFGTFALSFTERTARKRSLAPYRVLIMNSAISAN